MDAGPGRGRAGRQHCNGEAGAVDISGYAASMEGRSIFCRAADELMETVKDGRGSTGM